MIYYKVAFKKEQTPPSSMKQRQQWAWKMYPDYLTIKSLSSELYTSHPKRVLKNHSFL